MATNFQHYYRIAGIFTKFRLRRACKTQMFIEKIPSLETAATFTTSVLPHEYNALTLTHAQITFCPVRFASKKKSNSSKAKAKKRTSYTSDDEDDEDLPQSVEELVDPEELEEKFAQILKDLENQYTAKLKIRTTQGAFNEIEVPISKGKSVPLQYLGQISLKPPRNVLVNMTAQPQHIKVALTAIAASPLNVNPRIDGSTIIIETPQVTREHREKLAKQAKVMCDECKNKIRSQLNETMKLLKAGETLFSQNDIKPVSKMISELGVKYIKDSEAVMKKAQSRVLKS